jgi:hypothetical protein
MKLDWMNEVITDLATVARANGLEFSSDLLEMAKASLKQEISAQNHEDDEPPGICEVIPVFRTSETLS